jgi:hypothetical protein
MEVAQQDDKRRWWRDNRGGTTTSKGEDMVEVVRIIRGLREDKMGNVPRGGTCMGRGVGSGKLNIKALLFSDRYLQHFCPWKINQENFGFVPSKTHVSVESKTSMILTYRSLFYGS